MVDLVCREEVGMSTTLSPSEWAAIKGKDQMGEPNKFCMLCRDMFGACLREEGMVDLVCREVADATAKAPALSFLAAIARDHGAMPQALQLFRFSASQPACGASKLPYPAMFAHEYRKGPKICEFMLLNIMDPLLEQGSSGCSPWGARARAELHAFTGNYAALQPGPGCRPGPSLCHKVYLCVTHACIWLAIWLFVLGFILPSQQSDNGSCTQRRK